MSPDLLKKLEEVKERAAAIDKQDIAHGWLIGRLDAMEKLIRAQARVIEAWKKRNQAIVDTLDGEETPSIITARQELREAFLALLQAEKEFVR